MSETSKMPNGLKLLGITAAKVNGATHGATLNSASLCDLDSLWEKLLRKMEIRDFVIPEWQLPRQDIWGIMMRTCRG